MVSRPSLRLRNFTNMFSVTARSLCSCSRQTLCYASPTFPGLSPSNSLRSSSAPLETLSAASWCTVLPLATRKAMALLSTWRRTLRPGRNQSCLGSSLGHVCCTCTGLRLARSRFPCCTRAASVWTDYLKTSSPLRISAVCWLTRTLPYFARWVWVLDPPDLSQVWK